MKFHTQEDKKIYDTELLSLKLDEIGFIQHRGAMVKTLKDKEKASNTKHQWRTNRYKMMAGIKKFHKSTAGKVFHRQLGRFIALKDFSRLRDTDAKTIRPSLTSALTHMYLEQEYYMSMLDQTSLELLTECFRYEMESFIDVVENGSMDGFSQYEDLIYTVCESISIIKALATASDKSIEEVEVLWDKAKDIVKKQYKQTEDSEGFFPLVVGILKKMLGLVKGGG